MNADSFFEIFDLLAQRGLGQEEPLGGAGEVRSLRDGRDVFQMTKLNKIGHAAELQQLKAAS